VTLLAPTAAIIAGALALPALLVFYFLKLRRRPVRVSSTMLWEDAVHDLQVNAPFRMIRPTWLLLLQLIGLTLLILALGRPAINTDTAPSARTIILIDTSASMNARDAGAEESETRIDRAKARAIDEARRLVRSGAQVMVIAFDRDARALTELTSDADALVRSIESLEATDAPGDPRVAFALAETVASRTGISTGESERSETAEIVLIGDGQVPPGEPLAVAGATVRFEGVGASAPRNLAIGALSGARDPDDPAIIRVFARLTNTGAETASATATLSFQGDPVERRAVTVPAPDSGAFGEKGVTFQIRSREAGAITVALEPADADSDRLPADSTASVVIGSPRKPSVVLILPDDRVAEGNWRLEGIFEALDLLRLDKRGETVADEMARDGRLRRYDLAVYDGVTPARVPPIPSVSFGAAPPFEGLTITLHEGASRTLSWRRTHPVLRDVSMDTVLVGNASTFALSDDAPPDVELTELVRGEDGPFLVELTRGQISHIAAGFEVQQSNIWQTPALGLLLANIVDQLATGSSGATAESFTTGAPVRIAPPPGTRTVQLIGRTPNLPQRTLELEGREDETAMVALDRAGLYDVFAGGEAQRPIAVNLISELESSISRAESIAVSGEEIASTEGGEEPREVWHWFVIAAAIILMTEWLINSMLMRS